MTPDVIPTGASEEEIWEELKIRHELEPVRSREEYEAVIDEIIAEKVDFGEIHADEDTEGLKENLVRRYNDIVGTTEAEADVPIE